MVWEKMSKLLPEAFKKIKYQGSAIDLVKLNDQLRYAEPTIPKVAYLERKDEQKRLPNLKENTIKEPSADKSSSLYRLSALTQNIVTVKPHVPLIKFPKRTVKPLRKKDILDLNEEISLTTIPKNLSSFAMKKSCISIPNGPTLESWQLPPKYKRLALTIDEMEFIEKGGPV